MIHNEYSLNFHLFDGEGGGSGLGAEASAFAESIGLTEYSQKQSTSKSDSKPRVEYGKSKDENGTSQVRSDTSGNEADDLAAEWKALTGKGGKFHDLLGQEKSQTIQERFKNQQDLSGQIDQISDDLAPLFMNYGLEAGDFEGLKNAITNDDKFYEAGAEKAGLDIEQYKHQLELQQKADRAQRITDAYEQQQRQNEMFAQWEQEAGQLQQAFPGFDLGLEIENNEEFAKLIYNGTPVQTAFVSTHLQDILSGANADAEARATQNVVTAIQQRASRPAESAMRHVAAVERKSDPSSLTNDDMDEIIRRASEGESFAF